MPNWNKLAWIGLMDKTLADGGSEGLRDWWKSQNRKTRSQVALQVAMANRLIESDDHDTAQQIIIEGLKKHYDDRLVMPIPRLKTNNPEQLEKVLRQQIKTVGDRPAAVEYAGAIAHASRRVARSQHRVPRSAQAAPGCV
ncbi:HemY-like protein [Klebsiella michiganensis]|uniref:HemY-like protein n=1 Tax=Klebsiella michiganensis TaxID=1134687 RepID=A0A7H4PE16_9ENTR|nr:HemY-like protein [Klebsiella michiganensis]